MEESTFVKATYAASTVEAEQMLRHLEENGIKGYRQGGIMDIYQGNALTGEEIMVPAEQLERAQELLEVFRPIKTNGSAHQVSYTKKQTLFLWIALGVIVAICVALPLFLMVS